MRSASCLSIAFAAISLARAPAADQPAPASLSVFPPEVRLETRRDRQSVVVQASYPDGLTRDVSGEAKLTLRTAPSPPGPPEGTGAVPSPAREVAKIEGNLLHPTADGSTRLQVEFGGQ